MTEQTLKELIKQGPVRAQEISQWMKDHEQEITLLKLTKTRDENGKQINLMKKARAELADLRKMQNSIAENKDLSGEMKRKALDQLDKKVSALVDPLWKLLNAASSRGKG